MIFKWLLKQMIERQFEESKSNTALAFNGPIFGKNPSDKNVQVL